MESPVNHISVMKILQTMQNLSRIGRYLGISKSILLIEASKGTFCYNLKKDIQLWLILHKHLAKCKVQISFWIMNLLWCKSIDNPPPQKKKMLKMFKMITMTCETNIFQNSTVPYIWTFTLLVITVMWILYHTIIRLNFMAYHDIMPWLFTTNIPLIL